MEALPDFLIATPLLKLRSRVIAGAQHPVELTSLAAMVQLLQAGPYLACFAEGLPMLQPQLGLAILACPKPIWQHQAGATMHRSLARYASARELVEHVQREAAALARGAA